MVSVDVWRALCPALLAYLVFACASTPPAAQGREKFDPFSPPDVRADCEIVTPTAEDPPGTRTILSYLQGREMYDAKLIEVGYDSAGVPLWAIVRADELMAAEGDAGEGRPRSWRVIPHAYYMRFGRGLSGEG